MNQPKTDGPLVRSRNIAYILLAVGSFIPPAAALAGIGEPAQAGHSMAKAGIKVLLVFLCLATFFRHKNDAFKVNFLLYFACYVFVSSIVHVATSI